MKSRFCWAFCIILVFCVFSSCQAPQVPNDFDSSKFASKYRELDNFDELYLALSDYYTYVENAYDNSNKKTLSTFSISKNELEQYTSRIDNLTSLSDDCLSSDSAMESALLKLELAVQVKRVDVKIAEYEVLIAAGNKEHEAWFSELRSTLDTAYSAYYEGED